MELLPSPPPYRSTSNSKPSILCVSLPSPFTVFCITWRLYFLRLGRLLLLLPHPVPNIWIQQWLWSPREIKFDVHRLVSSPLVLLDITHYIPFERQGRQRRKRRYFELDIGRFGAMIDWGLERESRRE